MIPNRKLRLSIISLAMFFIIALLDILYLKTTDGLGAIASGLALINGVYSGANITQKKFIGDSKDVK